VGPFFASYLCSEEVLCIVPPVALLCPLAAMPHVEVSEQQMHRLRLAAWMRCSAASKTDWKLTGDRYYVTPTAYLDLIHLFLALLRAKTMEMKESRDRLQSGLLKLQSANELVEKLQTELSFLQPIIQEKSKVRLSPSTQVLGGFWIRRHVWWRVFSSVVSYDP
jgi:hypothetical protein